MKIKVKSGERITIKEFFHRWRLGIDSVDAYQQTVLQIWSTWIILIGILCGIVMTALAFKNVWWLTIILVGALFNTSIQMLGLIQKKRLLSRFHIPKQMNWENKVTDEEGNSRQDPSSSKEMS